MSSVSVSVRLSKAGGTSYPVGSHILTIHFLDLVVFNSIFLTLYLNPVFVP